MHRRHIHVLACKLCKLSKILPYFTALTCAFVVLSSCCFFVCRYEHTLQAAFASAFDACVCAKHVRRRVTSSRTDYILACLAYVMSDIIKTPNVTGMRYLNCFYNMPVLKVVNHRLVLATYVLQQAGCHRANRGNWTLPILC